jgi:hypothetical protein
MAMLRKGARAILGLINRALRRWPPDFEPAETADLVAVAPYTMTPPVCVVGLIRAVNYLVENQIPGDMVECGVWRGGSMMAVARVLLRLCATDRHLWLFDTFQGMTPPTAVDVSHDNQPADQLLRDDPWVRCEAGLDAVRKAVLETGYPADRVHFIPGRVEDTIPAQAPAEIALLRLDTDWYESTRHELVHLFPRLAKGGVLIIDEYGHWQGARKAADEYFHAHGIAMLLCRVDYSCRIGVKQ